MHTNYTTQHAPIINDIELKRYEPINVRFRTLRNIIGVLIACWCTMAVGAILLALVYMILVGRDIPVLNLFIAITLYSFMGLFSVAAMPKTMDWLNVDAKAKGTKLRDKGDYDRATIVCYMACAVITFFLVI